MKKARFIMKSLSNLKSQESLSRRDKEAITNQVTIRNQLASITKATEANLTRGSTKALKTKVVLLAKIGNLLTPKIASLLTQLNPNIINLQGIRGNFLKEARLLEYLHPNREYKVENPLVSRNNSKIKCRL